MFHLLGPLSISSTAQMDRVLFLQMNVQIKTHFATGKAGLGLSSEGPFGCQELQPSKDAQPDLIRRSVLVALPPVAGVLIADGLQLPSTAAFNSSHSWCWPCN